MALVPTEVSSPASVATLLSFDVVFLCWEFPSDAVAILSAGDVGFSKAWMLVLTVSDVGVGGIGVPAACVELLSADIVCLVITN